MGKPVKDINLHGVLWQMESIIMCRCYFRFAFAGCVPPEYSPVERLRLRRLRGLSSIDVGCLVIQYGLFICIHYYNGTAYLSPD